MLIGVCNCAWCGALHAVCGGCSSMWQCAWLCGYAAVYGCAAVYGSAHGSLQQCTQMCAAVHMPVCGSAQGSMW
jgi:hypothetical protein